VPETCSSREQFEIMAELTGRSGPMLDIHKNPLLVSILTSCEMLKALDTKGDLPLSHIMSSKALLFMKADKVRTSIPALAHPCMRCEWQTSWHAWQAFQRLVSWVLADWLWDLDHSRIRPRHSASSPQTERLVGGYLYYCVGGCCYQIPICDRQCVLIVDQMCLV